jgi:hypothetical protein
MNTANAISEESESQHIERQIRTLVEEVRPLVGALETMEDSGLTGFRHHGEQVMGRLDALVLGDPPRCYEAAEEAEFSIQHDDKASFLWVAMRVAIRTLEFWMVRTARAHGCADLERFWFRLRHLRDGDELEPFVREKAPADGLAADEEDARWYGRNSRDMPRAIDARTERLIAILRNNPGGLTLSELTSVANAEINRPPGRLS